jgi:hypothetical protein
MSVVSHYGRSRYHLTQDFTLSHGDNVLALTYSTVQHRGDDGDPTAEWYPSRIHYDSLCRETKGGDEETG